MTPPRRIGAVRIPRPWETQEDLWRLQCLDLHGMSTRELRRERSRLQTALGIASDDQLAQPMCVLWGAEPLTVEQYLSGRLELVLQLLRRAD